MISGVEEENHGDIFKMLYLHILKHYRAETNYYAWLVFADEDFLNKPFVHDLYISNHWENKAHKFKRTFMDYSILSLWINFF